MSVVLLKILLLSSSQMFKVYSGKWNITPFIPENYNTFERPIGLPPDNRTIVTVECTIRSIGFINLKSMTFGIHWHMRTFWDDYRFLMKEENQSVMGTSNVYQKIWTPIIYMQNEKLSKIMDVSEKNIFILIKNKTKVYMSLRLKSELICTFKLKNFPFDKQICNLHIGCCRLNVALTQNHEFILGNYNNSELLLQWRSTKGKLPVVTYKTNIRDIDLLSVKWANYTLSRYTLGDFSSLVVEFEFGRKFYSYLYYNYFESSFIVATSWTTFWLDASEVSSRVQLGITTILIAFTHNKMSSISSVKVGYVKYIDVWNAAATTFVIATFLETALAYQFRIKQKTKIYPENSINGIHSLNKKYRRGMNLDNYCKIIFPSLYATFVVAYWIVYTISWS